MEAVVKKFANINDPLLEKAYSGTLPDTLEIRQIAHLFRSIEEIKDNKLGKEILKALINAIEKGKLKAEMAAESIITPAKIAYK